LRIIGGKYKGRKITPPANLKARPTTDFAKEGLFNILNNKIDFEDITVLDLFSGTGSISYEFVSRGAAQVHLVEKNYNNFSGIKKIINELKITNIKPIHIDATAFLKTCNTKYDLVFADPPFDLAWIDELPDLIFNANILNDSGLFILEHPANKDFSNNLFFLETRRYGEVHFSFFEFNTGLQTKNR
jgi:16S rRNA (guanine(966)-N(2))-methyltransferase RsmD